MAIYIIGPPIPADQRVPTLRNVVSDLREIIERARPNDDMMSDEDWQDAKLVVEAIICEEAKL